MKIARANEFLKAHRSRWARMFRVVFGSLALGLATTIVFQILLLFVVGGKHASEIIFGYSIGLFVVGFGALWFPFIRKRMK